MARKALYEKTFNKEQKFAVRLRNRCRLCGARGPTSASSVSAGSASASSRWKAIFQA
jgi:hypothetical protein